MACLLRLGTISTYIQAMPRAHLILVASLLLACRRPMEDSSDSGDSPRGDSRDSWIDTSDGDADTDSDADTDTDTDADADTDTGPYSPDECEVVEASLGMAFIPNGSFVMGSSVSEPGHEPEENQIAVTLTHDFMIGTTEVTLGQFRACMGYEPKSDRPNKCSDFCPVETVTWYEAAYFTNMLSQAAGLPDCYKCTWEKRKGVKALGCESPPDPYFCEGYRLPTSAEWEYAARAGVQAAYVSGGNLADIGDINNCGDKIVLTNGTVLGDYSWYCGNNYTNPTEVRQLAPNSWGLYDVQGNVWEWTNDWSWPYEKDVIDPAGPTTGSVRIRRGGSFWSNADRMRLALHVELSPWIANYNIGFRVVRGTVPE